MLEPTTGIEPVNLFLTKEALYRLSYVGTKFWFGAGDEIRTRDLQLGRLELYQLSYSRLNQIFNYHSPQELSHRDAIKIVIKRCKNYAGSHVVHYQSRYQTEISYIRLALT